MNSVFCSVFLLLVLDFKQSISFMIHDLDEHDHFRQTGDSGEHSNFIENTWTTGNNGIRTSNRFNVLDGSPRLDNRGRIDDFLKPQRPKCDRKLKVNNGVTRIRDKGTLVRFQCSYGYHMLGAGVAVCVRGQWSDPPPSCVREGCRTMPIPLHGSMRQLYGGGVAVFTCNYGFFLDGERILTCDGQNWNGTAPKCLEIPPITIAPPVTTYTPPQSESLPDIGTPLLPPRPTDLPESGDTNDAVSPTTEGPPIPSPQDKNETIPTERTDDTQIDLGPPSDNHVEAETTTMTPEIILPVAPVTQSVTITDDETNNIVTTTTEKIVTMTPDVDEVTTQKPIEPDITNPASTTTIMTTTSTTESPEIVSTISNEIPEIVPETETPTTMAPETPTTTTPFKIFTKKPKPTKPVKPIKVPTIKPTKVPMFTRRPVEIVTFETTTTTASTTTTTTTPIPSTLGPLPDPIPKPEEVETEPPPTAITYTDPPLPQGPNRRKSSKDTDDSRFERVELIPEKLGNNIDDDSNPNRYDFGHLLVVIGITLIAIGLVTIFGGILTYYWRRNKGIARPNQYDLDGRTLSTNDGNDEFLWLDNRGDRDSGL